jgi:hypothetical protein
LFFFWLVGDLGRLLVLYLFLNLNLNFLIFQGNIGQFVFNNFPFKIFVLKVPNLLFDPLFVLGKFFNLLLSHSRLFLIILELEVVVDVINDNVVFVNLDLFELGTNFMDVFDCAGFKVFGDGLVLDDQFEVIEVTDRVGFEFWVKLFQSVNPA